MGDSCSGRSVLFSTVKASACCVVIVSDESNTPVGFYSCTQAKERGCFHLICNLGVDDHFFSQ